MVLRYWNLDNYSFRNHGLLNLYNIQVMSRLCLDLRQLKLKSLIEWLVIYAISAIFQLNYSGDLKCFHKLSWQRVHVCILETLTSGITFNYTTEDLQIDLLDSLITLHNFTYVNKWGLNALWITHACLSKDHGVLSIFFIMIIIFI